MAELVWDRVGERVYETGLDKGVLYLPDGSGVPWNGLTSVIEQFNKSSSPVYFDGMKIQDLVVLGDFAATMKAVTYPDEFIELEGLDYKRSGVFYADQYPKAFGLSYRTRIGNDLEGSESGYKIHILYNVTAIPNDKTYASVTDDPSLVEFEWSITAVPEEIPGFLPTAHIILDSRKVDTVLLQQLEEILYGSSSASAVLIPMSELVDLVANFFRLEVFDNGDGTWTATTEIEGIIEFGLDDFFEISAINAWYLDDDTYQLTSTKGSTDVPLVKIHDIGDGSWTATSDSSALIEEVSPGIVDINEANIVWVNSYTYDISDTPSV